jgi:hypothetical protein
MRRTPIARLAARAGLALGTLGLLAAAPASADSCREWSQEHWELKADVVRLYLAGASQETLDASVFELLQREAYMTSCDTRAQVDRAHQVGWRMLDRSPDEYASAVIEGLLVDGGLDLSLRGLFEASNEGR